MDSVRVAIVGAGVAGAATAWHLARLGVRPVLLLEQEKSPGTHSTGRNAAILRTAIPDPVLHALARESKAFYLDPPAGFPARQVVDPVGLFLAAAPGHEEGLQAWARDPSCQQGLAEVAPAELRRRIPLLAREPAAAFLQPDEGVLDVHAILQAFLAGARAGGVELRTGTRATGLWLEAGRLRGLHTDGGDVAAEAVVLAGGGMADVLAATAGLGLGLLPRRRHLLTTEPRPEVDPRWPVLWIAGDEFYFRPESGGLLMSACDTTLVPPAEGEVADPAILETIAEKASRWIPALADAGAAAFWAGLRTFAPDDRFLLGPDPRLEGLWWTAALGGHGITCAPAAGRITAEWLVRGAPPSPEAEALAPGRLLARQESR